ncbi:uncharacterized protein F4817DRAFT_315480 [Daldinia loculata]|uniref:uncharacterized protein n=1 Tax=Daldinia loculata TaxID=103429 RepID=UPI0020C4CDCA|nr:uncharacterized protein F4817DRAFT_315480 [Daldinia loculata]KAI1647615.1 hypothetical protein F4817DRAFT_315480 [Daldinia loculata]
MALEKERPALYRLPTELVISIFSYLPNVKSIQNLGRASKKFREILLAHEGVITRHFVAGHTNDDDPGVTRLAFIACKAREFLFGYGDLGYPFDGGIEFLEKYVERGDWPIQFYRLSALTWLPKLSKGIESVLDWVITEMAPLPLELEGGGFTSTEMSRQRRLLYMLDFISTFLEKTYVPKRMKPKFDALFKALWGSFSPAEIFLVYQLLERLYHFNAVTSDLHVVSPEVGLVMRSVHNLWCYKKCFNTFLTMKRFELLTGGDPPSWEPFVDDPSAFIRGGIPSGKDVEGSLEEYYYYSPLDFEWLAVKHLLGSRHWFFLIGDKDRCESVINHGRIWSWDKDTFPLIPCMHDSTIQWHQDPARFGFPGTVDTMLPLREFFGPGQKRKRWYLEGGTRLAHYSPDSH